MKTEKAEKAECPYMSQGKAFSDLWSDFLREIYSFASKSFPSPPVLPKHLIEK